MLFKDEFHFNDSLNERVNVLTKSNKVVGEGELIIEKGKLPRIEFDYMSGLSEYRKNTYFICQSSNFIFTLLGCEISGFNIYPQLIVKGKKTNSKFKSFSVLLQGVSEWMDNTNLFEGKITEKSIQKPREESTFNVNILDDNRRDFNISCEHLCSIGRKNENNYLIEQYTIITIKINSNSFSFDDVIEKSYEIRNIFSLLLGFPLSIERVFDKSDKSSRKSIYFPNASIKKNLPSSRYEYLSNSSYINKNNLWSSIFKNVYEVNSDMFQNLWSRVAGNLDNPAFWDYEILSYVSLVDKYVSHYANNAETKMPKAMFKELRSKILSVLSDAKTAENDTNNLAVLESVKKQVQSLRTSKFTSFRERFEFTLSEMDNDIKDIINLRKEHFADLKKFRDQVAHGNKPETKMYRNLTYESILKNKLIVLLFYWAYRDLGFSDQEFIRFLDKTHNPIIMQAFLDHKIIDRVLKNYPFLKVLKADLKKIQRKNYDDVVLTYNNKSKKYNLCQKYTLKTKGWYRMQNQPSTIEQYVALIVDNSLYNSIDYIGNVYVSSKDESYKIHGCVCILNCPYMISKMFKKSRRIELDEESNRWS